MREREDSNAPWLTLGVKECKCKLNDRSLPGGGRVKAHKDGKTGGGGMQ